MTTTYSPNLRLSIIGNGEQAGAWGDTTNTNLGTLLEGSISGFQPISIISTSQALVATNGAADQARLAMIQLNSSLGTAFSVFTPPSPKQYIFFNNSAQTATIYCATTINGTTIGGDGIAIPAGGTMAVWNTGAPDLDIKQQSTHFIAPTMSNPVMAGTPLVPTAAAGTDTLQAASTDFVKAAIAAAAQALYPLGSIYVNATNPLPPSDASLLGFGTWEAFGATRVLAGFDASNANFNAAGLTGGSANAVVVSHGHTATTPLANTAHSHTGTTAGGGAHGHNVVMRSSGVGAGSFNGAYVDTTCANIQANQYNSYAEAVGDHTHTFTTNNNTVFPTASTTVSAPTATAPIVVASGIDANYQPYITVFMWKRTG
jgi:hypothetical protein